ncbi:hypothetical protein DNTS_021582 [Danionella cerebrum]|uniref:Transmembrane protein 120A n=1 Tax=Danionella cerebrum TaxID=2873325 RepID=A0A553QXJ9_9TELE|nr:hypothetical protein DNTS_021582 [Danionella translucida]
MSKGLAAALQEWKIQEKEFHQLQESHRLYLQKLEEVSKLQKYVAGSIAHQKKNLKDNLKSLKKFSKGLTEEENNVVEETKERIRNMPNLILQMETFLPKKNGIYLSLVLGSVNVNLPTKDAKAEYKDEYERFKLYVTVILFLLSFICCFFVNYRFLDALLNFLLVWYYCTLTIRETILISNGSRPDGESYQSFRIQFLAYCLYQSFVEYLQYYYQSGCLYRLKALGERHNLDLTVEGFKSWMWRGLTFLLPFLFLGHFWQFWNSVCLFRMAQLPECREWQVSIVGFCFLILFAGNFSTTVAVVQHKRRNQKAKSM